MSKSNSSIYVFLLFLFAFNVQAATNQTDIIGTSFSLTNQYNQTTTEKSFGQPALLYFGFLSCPHICPTDLAKMSHIATAVEKKSGVKLSLVFITIDPERDTIKQLKKVEQFDKRFIGLTGNNDEIAKVADGFHVYYKKIPGHHNQDYMMDHSTMLFLLDSKGKYVAHFGRSVSETAITAEIIDKLTEK